MEKVAHHLEEAKRIIDSLGFNVHWYRRVFHAFGASFLLYYLLPNDFLWFYLVKVGLPVLLLGSAFVLEWMRLKGRISSSHFFGLRIYEEKRVGSFLFFGVALVILLWFFPQQIAIPCILCASLADPIMGELRFRLGDKNAYILGFLTCMFLFMVTWYKADIWLLLLVSIVGAGGAVLGETREFYWLDDDFMIQMIPAVFLLIIWIGAPYLGFTLPDPLIYPW